MIKIRTEQMFALMGEKECVNTVNLMRQQKYKSIVYAGGTGFHSIVLTHNENPTEIVLTGNHKFYSLCTDDLPIAANYCPLCNGPVADGECAAGQDPVHVTQWELRAGESAPGWETP